MMTEILRNFAKTSIILEKAAESLKEELGMPIAHCKTIVISFLYSVGLSLNHLISPYMLVIFFCILRKYPYLFVFIPQELHQMS